MKKKPESSKTRKNQETKTLKQYNKKDKERDNTLKDSFPASDPPSTY